MTEQGGEGQTAETPGRAAAGEQTWLVQVELEEKDYGGSTPRPQWLDVGVVKVPARTRRRTIIEKALELYPDAVPPRTTNAARPGHAFRVLDGDSAATIAVWWEVPPAPEPVLRIGGEA